jgi:hypothetical protein
MTQMMSSTAIHMQVASMICQRFIKLADASRILKLYYDSHISEGEQFEMLQELIDVATIAKLSKKDNSHA